MKELTLPAHAKLNLTLDILGKRQDGFHEVRMVMQSISLHDTVHVALCGGAGITCRCGDLPGDESNLAVKAARAFFKETGIAPCGLAITVEKTIPVCAGMAGGSADAAAVLLALRTLLAPQLPDGELSRIGATVGSDVPFCLWGGTALAQGRGERLTQLSPAPHFFAVVCKPDFPISTPMLYARADECTLTGRPDTEAMLSAIRTGDAGALARSVGNVFEQVLPPDCAEVFALKAQMLTLGAEVSAMTGSGPTVFGLFRAEATARAAADRLQSEGKQAYFTQFV